MIIVCTCGQRSRVRKLVDIDRIRCAKCKASLSEEAHRQAARNANIVLDIAAVLFSKNEQQWTSGETLIAGVMAKHERESRQEP